MQTHEQQFNRMAEHEALHFPTQRPNEKVVLLLRRHWTVIAQDLVQLIAALCLPPVILTVLILFSDFSFIPGTLGFILIIELLSIYFLFTFLFYFENFVDYHLDIWVVTDQRIVSIEQNGLFRRVISEVNILQIQDVTSEVNGGLQTFLDFGQVYIQTAGQTARFIFEEVAHSAEVAKVVLQVHDRAVKMRDIEQARDQLTYEKKFEAQEDREAQQGIPPINQAEHQSATMHRDTLKTFLRDSAQDE